LWVGEWAGRLLVGFVVMIWARLSWAGLTFCDSCVVVYLCYRRLFLLYSV
jgi:hypothetical protein